MGDDTLPIQEISRPGEDEVGPTRVYVSQSTFLTVAEQQGARLHVGDASLSIPAQMRKEMQEIFETVT
jgi:hypothetical protein